MNPSAITHYCAEWVRGDMTLRPRLCFLVGSIRGDIKVCRTKGKAVSCPGELPAAGVHGKMEKKKGCMELVFASMLCSFH